jgi:hypothetical protein
VSHTYDPSEYGTPWPADLPEESYPSDAGILPSPVDRTRWCGSRQRHDRHDDCDGAR